MSAVINHRYAVLNVVCCIASLIYDRIFFFQAEDGIRDVAVTGVQTCALPIFLTNYQAPKYKLVAYDVAHPEKGFHDVIAESNNVLQQVSSAEHKFIAKYMVDAKIGRASCRERV